MSVKYDKLTDEQQAQLVSNAIQNLEQEHFVATLNVKASEAVGDGDAVSAHKKNIENLEAKIEALRDGS